MRTWLMWIALSGCEHGQTPPDGGDDDGGTPGCAKESMIDGELIDWDSSDASFLGIADATVTLVFDSSIATVTPPNGRLSLCARPEFPLELLFDGPGDYLDGTLSIDRDALFDGSMLSLRAFTATRAASFFTERGLTFEPNAAQVVVLSTADRGSISLDLLHGTTQAGNGEGGSVTWSDGDAGRYVLFPNVVVTSSTAMVTDIGGTKQVPVASGKLTLVALASVFIGP